MLDLRHDSLLPIARASPPSVGGVSVLWQKKAPRVSGVFSWVVFYTAVMSNRQENQQYRRPDQEYCGWGSLEERLERLRANQSYILTFETRAMLRRLAPHIVFPKELIKEYENTLLEAFQQGVTVPVIPIGYEELYAPLENSLARAIAEAEQEGRVVVNFDRFIGVGMAANNLVTMSFGRVIDHKTGASGLGPRQNDPPLDEQFAILEQRANAVGTRELILVDDGVSDIETTKQYFAEFQNRGYRIVRIHAGIVPDDDRGDWATRKYLEDCGIEVHPVILCARPLDWVCARDGNIFGGKNIHTGEEIDGQPLLRCAPYFLPFTRGESASILPDKLRKVSRMLIQANKALFHGVKQALGAEKLPLRMFVEAGYSLPISSLGILPNPDLSMDIEEYIEWCARAVEAYTPDLDESFTTEFLLDKGGEELLDDLYPELANRIVVVMGPSGSGRTTTMRRLMELMPDAKWVPRTTSRPYREGEPREEIICATREEVQAAVANGDIIAACTYNGQLYGVSRERLLAAARESSGPLFVEGTIEVLGLLRRLGTGRMVVMRADSPDAYAVRLTSRDGATPETLYRAATSISHAAIISERVEALQECGLVFAMVVNRQQEDPNAAAEEIVKTLST